MFEEPDDESPSRPFDPAERAKAKADEFRMHAELAAVFEGNRKSDAAIRTDLTADAARSCQQIVGKLERNRLDETPVVKDEFAQQARELLQWQRSKNLSTNDYHIYHRPGETMIARWLEADQVASFYTRIQAHFDAALKQFRDDEKQSLGWKQEPTTAAYLEALDAIEINMEERYLRPLLLEHHIFVLSTQAADELDITHLCDFIMGVPSAEIVGEASAPPDEPTEQDRAWFFKLFALRGIFETRESMLFFAYLQKTDDSASW